MEHHLCMHTLISRIGEISYFIKITSSSFHAMSSFLIWEQNLNITWGYYGIKLISYKYWWLSTGYFKRGDLNFAKIMSDPLRQKPIYLKCPLITLTVSSSIVFHFFNWKRMVIYCSYLHVQKRRIKNVMANHLNENYLR